MADDHSNDELPASPPIVRAGAKVLRAPAAPVPLHLFGTPELRALLERMVQAMRDAPGVGLAAPQIGVGLQLLVIEDSHDRQSHLTPEQLAERKRTEVPLIALANPVLRAIGEEQEIFHEGCLSVPGYAALVPRAREVEVQALDPNGLPVTLRWTGWPARILQHECDHLQGTLYVDRMITRSFTVVE